MQAVPPDLAIVIPSLNERENLKALLPGLHRTIRDLGITAEIVVVDGGSSDGSIQAAQENGARSVLQEERGYGGALLAGFAATTAPYIATLDADLSHPAIVLADLWAARTSADVVVASRYTAGGSADMPWLRRFLSQVLNVAYRRALSLTVHDMSSGYRLYRRDVLSKIQPVARDFDILEEILIRVQAEGWRIAEVPFHYMPRGAGSSHARLLRLGRAFSGTLVRMWQLRNSVASADYDYRAYDSPILLQRYWQRERHRLILNMVESKTSLLDIGCGSSRIILDLPQAVGLDILLSKLRWLRPNHRLVVQASCDSLPFPDQSFDTVVCSEVIEHVPDSPAILAEMTRVLRPGGILILGTPDYGRLLWVILEWIYGKVLPGAYAEEHITHFTSEGLARRLRQSGYDVLDCRYVGFCEMIFKARRV